MMKSVLLFLTLIISLSAQNVIVVDPAGGGQFTTMSAALSSAQIGDTIKVMPGMYYENLSISKNVSFLAVDTTAIIGYATGSGISFNTGSSGASLVGFKLQLAVGVGVSNIFIAGNIFDGYGLSSSVNINLSNNVFKNTSVTLNFSDKKAYLLSNTFRNTPLTINASGTAKAIIKNNNFNADNETTILCTPKTTGSGKIILFMNSFNGGRIAVNFNGNGVYVYGNSMFGTKEYGIVANASRGYIVGNFIKSSKIDGIRLEYSGYSNSTGVYDFLIAGNVVRDCLGSGIGIGADMSVYASTNSVVKGEIKNNLVFSNLGNGISQIVAPRNWQYSGNGWSGGSMILIQNNISLSNNYGIKFQEAYSVSNYNCLFSNTNNSITGVDNIYLDPHIVNLQTNEFQLQSNSPCIDAGNPAVGDYDLDRTRNDMGIYGGSYNWENFNSVTGNATVLEFFLSPQATAQGNTITITGSGAGSRTQQSQIIKTNKTNTEK